jgi:uncharacterized protein involved in outer membrane biogenesis
MPKISSSATRRLSSGHHGASAAGQATLAPLALLTKTVYLPWIKLEQPDARLIRLSEKNNNWTFTLASDAAATEWPASSGWSFRLDNILFDRGGSPLMTR